MQQLTHFPSAAKEKERLIGLIDGEFYRWNIDGGNEATDSAIYMAPKKRTVWVNIYRKKNGNSDSLRVGDGLFDSRDMAERQRIEEWLPIGTYPIEFEE